MYSICINFTVSPVDSWKVFCWRSEAINLRHLGVLFFPVVSPTDRNTRAHTNPEHSNRLTDWAFWKNKYFALIEQDGWHVTPVRTPASESEWSHNLYRRLPISNNALASFVRPLGLIYHRSLIGQGKHRYIKYINTRDVYITRLIAHGERARIRFFLINLLRPSLSYIN